MRGTGGTITPVGVGSSRSGLRAKLAEYFQLSGTMAIETLASARARPGTVRIPSGRAFPPAVYAQQYQASMRTGPGTGCKSFIVCDVQISGLRINQLADKRRRKSFDFCEVHSYQRGRVCGRPVAISLSWPEELVPCALGRPSRLLHFQSPGVRRRVSPGRGLWRSCGR